jgi:hypothetical protein
VKVTFSQEAESDAKKNTSFFVVMKDWKRDNTTLETGKENREVSIENIVYSFNVTLPEQSIAFLKTCSKLASKSSAINNTCAYLCMVWTETGNISICFHHSGKVKYVELHVPAIF